VTEVAHHSVRYDFRGIPGYAIVPQVAWRAGYLLLVCVPFVASWDWGRQSPASRTAGLAAGAVLVASFAVSYLYFWDVFTSIWCFVAAALSLLLCFLFSRLPAVMNGDGRPRDSAGLPAVR
jgi:hypothetical protein